MRPPKKFTMLADSEIRPDVKKGDVVYEYMGNTYGLKSEDTRMTGVEHDAYTKDPEGGSPFFTHPVSGVQAIVE